MSKLTRFKYFIAQRRGTALTKTADYSLTEADILKSGYSFVKLSNNATLTLPAASAALEGVSILVYSVAQGVVYVSGGYGGGGSNYDNVSIGTNETVEFWCDGSYWYALSPNVTGAGSSSSSSSSSISSSSSSSSSMSSSSSSISSSSSSSSSISSSSSSSSISSSSSSSSSISSSSSSSSST